jgi:hypothetical protein
MLATLVPVGVPPARGRRDRSAKGAAGHSPPVAPHPLPRKDQPMPDDDDGPRRFLGAGYWRGRQPRTSTLRGASLTDPAAGGRRTSEEDDDDAE